MNRIARAVARMAARTLPFGVRERYREEWLSDIAGSRETGVATSGIAIGAVLFSVTLRRDTPDVIGMPLSVAARRHARWAAALLLSAIVFAFGSYLNGGFYYGDARVPIAATTLSITLTFVATAAGLAALWRAAAISSPLAKIAATALTASVLALGSGPLIPATSVLSLVFMPVGLLLGMAGTLLGAVAWAGSTGATEPSSPDPTPDPSSRRAPLALKVALTIAGVLLAALVIQFSSELVWLGAYIVPAFVLSFRVVIVVRARRTARTIMHRGSVLLVSLTSALALAAIAVGALDLLIWSPLAQAPGYTLDEIWAALSPADVTSGIGSAVTWIVFWTAVVVVYVSGSIATLGRAARPSTRSLAAEGLLLIAGLVFFQFIAGFSLGISVADTLPPFSVGGSAVRAWYSMAGQLALVAMLVLSIAPRPLGRQYSPAAHAG